MRVVENSELDWIEAKLLSHFVHRNPRQPHRRWPQRPCTALALALRAGESATVSQGASTIWRGYPMGRMRRMGRRF